MTYALCQSTLVTIGLLTCMPTLAFAQEAASRPSVVPEKQDDKPADRRPAYIEKLEVVLEGRDQPVPPLDRPLFSYADSARIIADGAIWAWSDGGRPLAMAKCWENRNGTRTCAFTLTSDERVVARGPQSKTWQPEKTQIEPTKLAGAPAPDPKDSVRLRQLKEQARRFTAHEFWNPENARYELRLLIQPVHRYRDEAKKIDDGEVFLLAYDNNPQILLFLEILSPAAGPSRWQYFLARVSSADLHVSLDGKEIWAQAKTPGIIGQPTDCYWHMVTKPEAQVGP
jgi:hypothetical protein